jgi:hypothetical protein
VTWSGIQPDADVFVTHLSDSSGPQTPWAPTRARDTCDSFDLGTLEIHLQEVVLSRETTVLPARDAVLLDAAEALLRLDNEVALAAAGETVALPPELRQLLAVRRHAAHAAGR